MHDRLDLDVTTTAEVARSSDETRVAFEGFARDLDDAGADATAGLFDAFDRRRRTWQTGTAGVQLRYLQDTADRDRAAAHRELDRRRPAVDSAEKAVKERFLASSARAELQRRVGAQAFACWQADAESHDAAIEDDLVRESELENAYTTLVAGATAELRGERLTLSEILPSLDADDRDLRHDAQRARWSIFAENAARLDEIFDDLVHVRDRMARARGFASFTELGARRLHRVDYAAADVARFRQSIATQVVPLARELVARLGRERGLDAVRFWDEGVLAKATPLRTRMGRDALVETGVAALAAMDPSLAEFGEFMREHDLFDVAARPGKAFGAFCTMLPTHGAPFVFANLTGAPDDVRTLMHELGHAFQGYRSREKPVVDYLVPTYDAAEIHSMALEYLSWPQMERFFGEHAGAYRRDHLFSALLFLPYAAAVDEFQHLVYEHPSATPPERNAMWQELERTYLPWRDYGDLAHPRAGGLWQEKRHIYRSPFYYIDYALALACALQFAQRASTDREETMDAYVRLCSRGGEAGFRDLVASAGLRSPFDDGLESSIAGIRRSFATA